MKRVSYFLAITTLSGFMALLSAPRAEAGRVAGPASWPVVLQGYGSVSYDIPFAAGQAAISVSGNGSSNVSLEVSDGSGHRWVGGGFATMKTVTFDVVREGTFHVVIQNLGTATDTFTLRTN